MPIPTLLADLDYVRGRHSGRRGVVLGSGWSLDDVNWDEFDNDIVFACNQAVTAVKHATYFCQTDGAVVESNFFDYGASISDEVFFLGGVNFLHHPVAVKKWHESEELRKKAYFFDRRYLDGAVQDWRFDVPHKSLIVGSDVCQPTVHMAWVMGCSPIILCGIDLCYRGLQKYCLSKAGFDVQWSHESKARVYSADSPDGWFQSRQPGGADDAGLDGSYTEWLKIKGANQDVKILNGSPDGRLKDIFPFYK